MSHPMSYTTTYMVMARIGCDSSLSLSFLPVVLMLVVLMLISHTLQVQQRDADIENNKEQLAYLQQVIDKQVKVITGLENDIFEANEKVKVSIKIHVFVSGCNI